MESDWNLSDKELSRYSMEDLKEGLETDNPFRVFAEKDVREFIKRLKEVLVCSYCLAYPDYDGICSLCNNTGIKIDKLAGEKLI